jgi:hypothetical protein
MLRLSYYPFLWKFAQIIMVPKPGKPAHDVASYRPISLLPIPSKVFEKLSLKRLRSDVGLSHLIPGYQFGFRPGHSPIQQAHRVVNAIVTSLEERTLCTAVFLDVAQAFDKVWHIGLLYKLKTDLPGPYYLLLKTYLTDRYFLVRYNDTCSDCHEVRSGVLQGSVLGPLLHLLFTAHPPTTDCTSISTFADYTGLLAVHCDPVVTSQRLQSHLSLLHGWFEMCKIRVKPEMSAHVTFTTRHVTCPPVSLHTTPIPVKSEVKYLGLHLNRKLTWRKHTQTKRQHLDLNIRAMSWLPGRRSQLSLSNKFLLYKCILKPVWTNGIQLWGCAKPSHTQNLQRLQTKILRTLANDPWYVSNLQLHTDLGIPFVAAEIRRSSLLYHHRLNGQYNALVVALCTPPTFPGG